MRPLELAQQYMDIFFSGRDVEALRSLFADDFTFSGPFYEFDSAEDYIHSLQSDPPKDCHYTMIRSFEDEFGACLVYEFSKPGVCTPMTQVFEVRDGKISNILLVFDTDAFT